MSAPNIVPVVEPHCERIDEQTAGALPSRIRSLEPKYQLQTTNYSGGV